MKLNAKTLLIMGIVFFVLIAILYYASQEILLANFGELERDRTIENMKRVRNALYGDIAALDKFAHDWAAWNDTYEFVQDPGKRPDYSESNLVDETFADQRLNFILFFNDSGRLVAGKAYDFHEEREIPLREVLKGDLGHNAMLLRHPHVESSISGIAFIGGVPALVASRPIITSENKGPIRGTLIMGRYLDAGVREQLARITLFPVEIYGGDDTAMPKDLKAVRPLLTRIEPYLARPLDEDRIAGYARIPALCGKHSILIRVATPRDMYRHGLASVAYLVLSLVLAALAAGSVAVILIRTQVINRLTRLGAALGDIGKKGDMSAMVQIKGRDEIADLAVSISGMLAALENAQADLRESEHRYRMLLTSVPQKIFYKDLNSVYMLCNKTFAEDLGIVPEQFKGKTDYDFFPRELADKYREDDRTVMQSGVVRDIEEEYIKGGEKYIVHTIKAPVTDSAGNIIGVFGICWDITERKKLEAELIKSQKLESLGILAGGIAHDFNNILTAMVGYLSLVQEEAGKDEKVRGFLMEAERAALQAKGLTQQLLTFSKGGAPKKELLSLGELLTQIVRFAVSGSSSTCDISISDDLWAVEADEGQISQVANNLVLNAIQAMPKGGRIEVRAENVPGGDARLKTLPPGDYVMFSVSDSGIGIPEDHIPRIFDPYFTTKQTGSGLGLAICYSIVRNHGGTIAVESKLGKGSRFSVFLPAVSGEAVPTAKAEALIPRGTGRVLLMDDEETVRQVASSMLSHLGYEVTTARDGSEMVALYRKALQSGKPFRAVIVDLTIAGGMGGEEAIGILKKMDPGVNAIVSSGYATDPIIEDCMRYGFKGFVAKPYSIVELGKELHMILGKPGRERE